jgi:hypothetical protein
VWVGAARGSREVLARQGMSWLRGATNTPQGAEQGGVELRACDGQGSLKALVGQIALCEDLPIDVQVAVDPIFDRSAILSLLSRSNLGGCLLCHMHCGRPLGHIKPFHHNR